MNRDYRKAIQTLPGFATILQSRAELFGILYGLASIICCTVVGSHNGLILCMVYSMFLLYRKDEHCSTFMVIQITSILFFIVANYFLASTIDTAYTHLEDDKGYIELAKQSYNSFSFSQIFYDDLAERNVYRVFPELLPGFSGYIIKNMGYNYLLGLITRYIFVFPVSSLDYLFVNSFPALGLILFTKKIANHFYGERISDMAGTLLIFYPSFIVHSFIALKDIWIAFSILCFVYLVSNRKLYASIVPAMIVVLFRFKASFVLPLIVLIKSMRARTLVVCSVILLAVAIRFDMFDFFRYSQVTEKPGITGQIYTLPTLLRYPGFFLMTLLSHFPPVHSLLYDFNASYIFYDLGSLYWIVLIPYLFLGFGIGSKGAPDRTVPLAFAVLMLGMVITGWIDLRWRMMLEPFAFCLIALGITRRQLYKLPLTICYTGIGLLFAAYLAVKIVTTG